MKKLEVLFCLLVLAYGGYSQTANLLISGGYAQPINSHPFPFLFHSGQGWRVSVTYEELSPNNRWAYGINTGYMYTYILAKPQQQPYPPYPDRSYNMLPIYYSHKFLIGDGNLRGYVKGLLGFSFNRYKEYNLENWNDSFGWYNGFLTGLGAGGMYSLKNKMTFLFVDYEFQARDFHEFQYNNSVSLGIGFKLK